MQENLLGEKEESQINILSDEVKFTKIVNDSKIVDIDNDGIMEILIEMPTRDVVPSEISVLKYKNGDLSGKTDIGCTLVK